MNQNLVYLIPLLPLLGFAIIGLANRSLSKSLTTVIGCGSVGISFILSLMLFFNLQHATEPIKATLFNWINTGNFNVNFSFLIDSLSSIFLLVITGVGFLIHVYSSGYMHDDDGYRRFFAYLNLFIFFMLMLVMGDSFLLMFVGWEGVGLCSYLLIGFWFKNIDYSSAAKKAFIVNRIGDLGFLLGMFLLYTQFDSLSYDKIMNEGAASTVSPMILTIATLLLFIGAMGKSAQIPLYTWLPDAMAGPTPVSALIHAATMVTAGIYMIARANVIFAMCPITMNVVLVVGLLTALMAATIGLYQNDIKKVLAYSTVSQLGLMFAALGVGGFTAAVFHVVTHAFFKALLFLGAGSVIHAMSGEQDIRNMGGLKKALPITFMTFVIGTLAISGIPPFAGFFSKDQILAELLYKKGPIVFGIGILVSLMTCFYMFRLLFLTFFGKFRGTHEQEHHLHESPASMTMPLIVLAVLAAIAGFAGVPHGIGESIGVHHWFDHYLSSSVKLSEMHFSASQEWMMIGGTTLMIALTILFAYSKFVSKASIPEADSEMSGIKKLIYNKYYVDEAYNKIFTQPLDKLSAFTQKYVDGTFIDGIVNGTGNSVRSLGNNLREVQSGNLGSYLLAMVLAMVAILFVSLL
jgi:NADH-quinone oxidoreductase subunit L